MVCWGVVLAAAAARAAPAQELEHHIHLGDSLAAAMRHQGALLHYEAALAEDSTSYQALWKAAGAVIDIAKQLDGDANRRARDSLYLLARGYAEAAVRSDSLGADGYFMLAQTVGRLARTRGGRERVRFGRVIYDAAARAIELNPAQDGAHHVLGAWHAEVKRLSGLTRFFAKTFLGAGFLGRAQWDSAVVHLERAVELRPEYIYHRLELAQVYLDRGRYDDARAQLERIAALPPVSDVLDPKHQAAAARLLAGLESR